jgi:hypothetical protein
VKRIALFFMKLRKTWIVNCGIAVGVILPAHAQETHQIGSTLQASIRPSPPASSPAPAATSTPAPTPNPSSAQLQTAPMAEVAVVPDRIVRVSVQSAPNGTPAFDPPRFEVTAGQQVEVILRNNEAATSGVSHNWVLIKPGSESAVAALGKEAGVDPDAVTYSPSILAATRTTRPGNEGIVDFLAPEKPGAYPFISLVGDQRKVLRGVLVVKPVDQTPG